MKASGESKVIGWVELCVDLARLGPKNPHRRLALGEREGAAFKVDVIQTIFRLNILGRALVLLMKRFQRLAAVCHGMRGPEARLAEDGVKWFFRSRVEVAQDHLRVPFVRKPLDYSLGLLGADLNSAFGDP